MMSENTKNLVMSLLLAISLFFIAASAIQYTKGDNPFKTLFEDWKGWIAPAVAVLGGGASWWYMSKKAE